MDRSHFRRDWIDFAVAAVLVRLTNIILEEAYSHVAFPVDNFPQYHVV